MNFYKPHLGHTSMTLQMYADHKNIALDHISTAVTHEKRENEDGERVDVFNRVIDLHGPEITEEIRARFLEIADKCPVHKTLHGHVEIHTRKA